MRNSDALPLLHHEAVKYALIVVVAVCAACAKPAEEKVVNVRPMAVAPLKVGDCVEARRRAAAEPGLEVDRLPTLVAGPRPFVPTPESVQADIDKKGMNFKADVVIDTMGKAIVGSLKVQETSNEWFPRNLKALLPRMTFSPAMLAGCKVERVYKFTASAKAKSHT
jgi:hypothetical protein